MILYLGAKGHQMNATVFYAWQSDRPSKVNRNLIRGAAEAACKRITEDESNLWNLTLDSDTQGVAGMCDIPNTILEKIKAHPSKGCVRLKMDGHADPLWSLHQGLQKEEAACPRVYCTMLSGFGATGT